MPRRTPFLLRLSVLALVGLLLGSAALRAAPATAQPPAPTAGGFLFYKYPIAQPLCTGIGLNVSTNRAYSRDDCGFLNMTAANVPAGAEVKVNFRHPVNGAVFATVVAAQDSQTPTTYQADVAPGASWPAGAIPFEVLVGASTTPVGGGSLLHNALGATVTVTPKPGNAPYAPGEDIPLTGVISKLDTNAAGTPTSAGAAAATFALFIVRPDGTEAQVPGQISAGADGSFSATIPGSLTSGIQPTAATNYRTTIAIEARDASHADATTGAWAAARAGGGAATIAIRPTALTLENSFVSAVGWVKPDQGYTFRLVVRNPTANAASAARVTLPVPDGAAFLQAAPVAGSGSATINPTTGQITWDIGAVPAAAADGTPAIKTLVVQAQADSLGEDPRIVWKNLSSRATLTYAGLATPINAESHGPKVIPQGSSYDTARYGDRPFPVVPVDYTDRQHEAAHTGELLSNVLNDPNRPGSTFNLFQEMSFGQLFPQGTVPSAAIGSADFTYGPGFQFSQGGVQGTCTGFSRSDFMGTALYPERIVNGWYQLPGDTAYYGGDKYGSAVAGSVTGLGQLMDIDSACGPTGKAVFDAAQLADPEIDYSDYDTDKDGVVDFFMMVFVGLGGNGASQLNVPPYDNIWPHSSSLEFYYTDADGQKGYVSDDQLKDLAGRPLFWTDASRTQMTTTQSAFKVFVRVGPYNVNPEAAMDAASVISHEYGHSLGLPDFYSLGSRETYGTWNLMAADHSQHMDVFGKQEMGWIVPKVLKTGTLTATMQDSKTDTGRIDWVDANGQPYALTGPGIHNGDAYVAKLPARELIDPQKIIDGASPTHVWWSQAGNDFGCAPAGGHNLDIVLPGLADVPAGTEVKVTFRSLFEIEWDYDYGFVMVSTDGGETYQSLASEEGTTTAASQNPNQNGCQAQYGNGITGSSASYAAGTVIVDRATGAYPDPVFITDTFALPAEAVGLDNVVLRFSYATDPGLAKAGWFIDNLSVTAGDETIFASDFEDSGDPDDPFVFNGGCKEDLRVAAQCTSGWQFVDGDAGSPADHAYYLEMRDRSGFDFNGKGQSDRGDPTWSPGLLLVYTDEARGYGNVGTDNPPAQSPLDSQPESGSDTPNLDDAAWTAAAGDSRFSDSGEGHVDNYSDPAREDSMWRFDADCLTFDVLSMQGEDIGPDSVPGNLSGSVRFRLGPGCGEFDYGLPDRPRLFFPLVFRSF